MDVGSKKLMQSGIAEQFSPIKKKRNLMANEVASHGATGEQAARGDVQRAQVEIRKGEGVQATTNSQPGRLMLEK